jgi:acyl-CoA synthetase (AMP-forming)/AMP-acid ligase II/acyl carrier protein
MMIKQVPLSTPPSWDSLVEILRWRADHQSDQPAFTFLPDGETNELTLTYGDLDLQARAIAAQLQARGLQNQPVLLIYPHSLDYVVAFFACLYAGAIAVPIYPPRNNRSLNRVVAVAEDAGASTVLTTDQVLENFVSTSKGNTSNDLTTLEQRTWIPTTTVDTQQAHHWQTPTLTRENLAFLQYTSGSTSSPKGVMVSHGNLLHNGHLLQHGFDQPEHALMVSWLPLYHDMGLIGGMIQPLLVGYSCVMMASVAFLQKPLRWLQAMTRYRATITGAPNFAYELCIQKIKPEQLAELDLQNWTVAFNGAEPVRADTIQRFSDMFAPCGFRRETFYPCYGLAEATLFVTGGKRAALPVVAPVQTSALTGGYVVPATSREHSEEITLQVGCGYAWDDQQVMIVDPQTAEPCAPDRVGEIWISGPSIAQGYWKRQEESDSTFRARLSTDSHAGPFLRTGDLGFQQDGELFIAGRIKDLIIIRGRNHYPQDIEHTAERSHPDLRANGGAAFTITHEQREHLVMVHEVERRALARLPVEEIATAMRQAIVEQHGIRLYAVAFLKPSALPKTSSGKVQRNACRTAFLQDTLECVGSHTLGDMEADMLDELAGEAICTRKSLMALAPEERPACLKTSLQALVASPLGMLPSQIGTAQALSSLGFDSLMIVQIKQQIEASMGVAMPSATRLAGMAIDQLAPTILSQLAEEPSEDETHGQISDQLDHLSDEQVEAMLRDMIEQG